MYADYDFPRGLPGSVQRVEPVTEPRFATFTLYSSGVARPWTSLLDDRQRSVDMFEYRNALRQVALRPLKLHAGQTNKPNGEFGRYFAWDPIMVPEMTGGRILTTTV
ncbi:MAG: hypothetical protein LBR82_09820 [Desulfovibrio sp.]|jgi:hypothetical protein|nr:hypothetical protein [Desulfovibrio sp.]